MEHKTVDELLERYPAFADFPQLLDHLSLEELTGIPQATWRYRRHRGQGPPAVKIGSRVYYDKADVLKYLEAHREGIAES